MNAADTNVYVYALDADRDTIVNMVVTLKGVSVPQPGFFLVELLLDNQWVADTTVELK